MMHWSEDPFDAEPQLSRSRRVARSAAEATGLAENYAGLWFDYEYARRRA
jgi:p-hydroxybenzoate 3-monooxygenase